MTGILLVVIGFAGAIVVSTSQAAEQSRARPGPGQCADPAADIEVAIVSKTGPRSGRVRLTGIVRNLGSTPWKPATKGHRLHMVLAAQDSAARPNGEHVEPPLAIALLAPSQQFRIDHQMDWNADNSGTPRKYIVYFFESGKTGGYPARYRPDCRADNNRMEISAADINKLFSPAPSSGKPLEAQGYRLLGGESGNNTVESVLAFKKSSSAAGKLTASVAAPYRGTAAEVPVSGNTGMATVRVQIPCDRETAPGQAPHPVVITYRLWNSLGQPGTSRWVAGFSTEQSIPYATLCAARR